jgi:DNA-directed RNA polymerase specialized sigma24 family protein
MTAHNYWDKTDAMQLFQARGAEYIGQAFLELRSRHGSQSVYPGAAMRRAKLRNYDEQKRQSRLAKRRVPLEDIDSNAFKREHEWSEPESLVQAKESATIIEQALAQLPTSVSDAIRHCTMLGNSTAGYASTVGCTRRAIQKRISVGLRRLKSNKALLSLSSN